MSISPWLTRIRAECRGLAPLINTADLRTIPTAREKGKKRGGGERERKDRGNKAARKLGAVGCFKRLIILMTWIMDFCWFQRRLSMSRWCLRNAWYTRYNDRLIMGKKRKERSLFQFLVDLWFCRPFFFLFVGIISNERNTGCSPSAAAAAGPSSWKRRAQRGSS